MNKIENLEDHMAFSCQCGCVRFNLLKSGGIECDDCGEKIMDTTWGQAIEQAEKQAVFKIYKPTLPRGAIPNVRDAELPWVYDQDPWSGNVASMWVTPVKATLQPQQEPVAWMCSDESLLHKGYSRFSRNCEGAWNIPVYTTAQREWVGLTDEETDHLFNMYERSSFGLVRAVEAKLKEKNT